MTRADTAVPRGSGWYFVVAGGVGLIAAFALTVERFKIFLDPHYRPSCSINPVLSCGSVMVTDQAAIFGFPNPILGLVGFTAVVVTGILVAAETPLPGWYRLGLWSATIVGVAFVHWLIFESLYRIGALCPYCMVVWAVTIPTLTVASRVLFDGAGGVGALLLEWRWTLTAVWFAVLLLLIYLRFASYWNTLVR